MYYTPGMDYIDYIDKDRLEDFKSELTSEEKDVFERMLSGDEVWGMITRVEDGIVNIEDFFSHTTKYEYMFMYVEEFEGLEQAKDAIDNYYWIDIEPNEYEVSIEDLTYDPILNDVAEKSRKLRL